MKGIMTGIIMRSAINQLDQAVRTGDIERVRNSLNTNLLALMCREVLLRPVKNILPKPNTLQISPVMACLLEEKDKDLITEKHKRAAVKQLVWTKEQRDLLLEVVKEWAGIEEHNLLKSAANYTLGCYYYLEGRTAALHYYKVAADLGDAEAGYLYGSLYKKGILVGADPQKARTYFEDAANKGHREAQKESQEFSGMFSHWEWAPKQKQQKQQKQKQRQQQFGAVLSPCQPAATPEVMPPEPVQAPIAAPPPAVYLQNSQTMAIYPPTNVQGVLLPAVIRIFSDVVAKSPYYPQAAASYAPPPSLAPAAVQLKEGKRARSFEAVIIPPPGAAASTQPEWLQKILSREPAEPGSKKAATGTSQGASII